MAEKGRHSLRELATSFTNLEKKLAKNKLAEAAQGRLGEDAMITPDPTLEQKVQDDLRAIRDAIANGQTEEAERKISGLSLNVAAGSTFSKEIGDLWWELGFPAMAGRYWYLLENKSEHMLAACKEFEHSVGNSPGLIADALVYAWHAPLSPSAEAKLKELSLQARQFRREYRYDIKLRKRTLGDGVALLGCATLGSVVIFVFVAGVIFIATWFR